MSIEKEEIPFEGGYWWGDSQNVTEPLKKLIMEELGETRVRTIEIKGCDFQDGMQSREIYIEIDTRNNKITIAKHFRKL